MKRKKGAGLAVLDFSGTLSLGAVHFGRPRKLERALQESGLAALGLSPKSFWSELINPAWEEGSTGSIGYRRLLCEGVRRLAAARGENPSPEAVWAAAGRFTASYLRSSTIEPEWVPFLRRLAGQKVIAVATDHYAEATVHIIQQLAALGLDAAPARQAQPGQILVANSADLGYHKENPNFWKALRQCLEPANFYSVAIVDDFGHNEQADDSYAAAEKIPARQAATVKAITPAWQIPVNVFPFLLHCKDEFLALVEAAGRFLME